MPTSTVLAARTVAAPHPVASDPTIDQPGHLAALHDAAWLRALPCAEPVVRAVALIAALQALHRPLWAQSCALIGADACAGAGSNTLLRQRVTHFVALLPPDALDSAMGALGVDTLCLAGRRFLRADRVPAPTPAAATPLRGAPSPRVAVDAARPVPTPPSHRGRATATRRAGGPRPGSTGARAASPLAAGTARGPAAAPPTWAPVPDPPASRSRASTWTDSQPGSPLPAPRRPRQPLLSGLALLAAVAAELEGASGCDGTSSEGTPGPSIRRRTMRPRRPRTGGGACGDPVDPLRGLVEAPSSSYTRLCVRYLRQHYPAVWDDVIRDVPARRRLSGRTAAETHNALRRARSALLAARVPDDALAAPLAATGRPAMTVMGRCFRAAGAAPVPAAAAGPSRAAAPSAGRTRRRAARGADRR